MTTSQHIQPWPECANLPWRVGRRNPYTIYAQVGEEHDDDLDPYVGSLNLPELTKAAVDGHNYQLQARKEGRA